MQSWVPLYTPPHTNFQGSCLVKGFRIIRSILTLNPEGSIATADVGILESPLKDAQAWIRKVCRVSGLVPEGKLFLREARDMQRFSGKLQVLRV